MNPTQSTRFEVIKQHGHHYLRLSLPEGSPVLDDICCNDDYDYEVPDAVIDINLTGDYLWRSSAKIGAGKFRPLRPLQPA